MKLTSTAGNSPPVDLKTAVLNGMPPDGGLYMPVGIPQLPAAALAAMSSQALPEIALAICRELIGDEIPAGTLRDIVETAINFPAPLVPLDEHLYTLELFHGPTLAFKDFAARFMAQLMRTYLKDDGRELTILVATSGDTGSAVASGFYKTPGIRVYVLYPAGKVSHIQEQQLTTLGENVVALEVDGSFDDCQRMVKGAFGDADITRRLRLTSANSINIARLIPQTFYHAYAASRLGNGKRPLVISVPSGNLGNLTAGLMAKKMGIAVARFVAAANRNDVFPRYLATGHYAPQTSCKTLSNAMDVGNPSNAARIRALYRDDVAAMRDDISGSTSDDAQTVKAIRELYDAYGYVADPHGAVGYHGLRSVPAAGAGAATAVFLETAHPAKFADIVASALDISVDLPPALREALARRKQATAISAGLEALKEVLLAEK